MPSYRTSTSSSNITLEKHSYKLTLCPGDQTMIGEKEDNKRITLLKDEVFIHAVNVKLKECI